MLKAERQRSRRANETPKQRATRNATQRSSRANETPDQRAATIARQRSRRVNATPKREGSSEGSLVSDVWSFWEMGFVEMGIDVVVLFSCRRNARQLFVESERSAESQRSTWNVPRQLFMESKRTWSPREASSLRGVYVRFTHCKINCNVNSKNKKIRLFAK